MSPFGRAPRRHRPSWRPRRPHVVGPASVRDRTRCPSASKRSGARVADEGAGRQRRERGELADDVGREQSRRGVGRRTDRRPEPTGCTCPSAKRAPAADGVVADDGEGADAGADCGARRPVDPHREREGDGHGGVAKSAQHAARQADDDRPAPPASVASGLERRDLGTVIGAGRTEQDPAPEPMPDQRFRPPGGRAGRTAARTARRPDRRYRRRRAHPRLDVDVEVDDSCSAPLRIQLRRSTTGEWRPNPPPSSI